jgi:hypothetical protein
MLHEELVNQKMKEESLLDHLDEANRDQNSESGIRQLEEDIDI